MHFRYLLFLIPALFLLPMLECGASTLATQPKTHSFQAHELPRMKGEKPGLFKSFKAIRALKKQVRAQTENGEKASAMAKIALGIFGASLLIGAIGSSIPALAWLALFGLLGSNVLAIIVLSEKPNKRSKAIALAITIITLALVVVALLALLFILAFFAALF